MYRVIHGEEDATPSPVSRETLSYIVKTFDGERPNCTPAADKSSSTIFAFQQAGPSIILGDCTAFDKPGAGSADKPDTIVSRHSAIPSWERADGFARRSSLSVI